MRVLLDHNVDRRLRVRLSGHDVATARELGWETLANGALTRAAADAGFGALVSIDKKLEHEQNLLTLPLPLVVLDALSNALPSLLPLVPELGRLLSNVLSPGLYVIARDGTSRRIRSPGA